MKFCLPEKKLYCKDIISNLLKSETDHKYFEVQPEYLRKVNDSFSLIR